MALNDLLNETCFANRAGQVILPQPERLNPLRQATKMEGMPTWRSTAAQAVHILVMLAQADAAILLGKALVACGDLHHAVDGGYGLDFAGVPGQVMGDGQPDKLQDGFAEEAAAAPATDAANRERLPRFEIKVCEILCGTCMQANSNHNDAYDNEEGEIDCINNHMVVRSDPCLRVPVP